MRIGLKRAISYAVGVIALAAVLNYLFIPVAPDKIVYPMTNGGKTSLQTFYLTYSPVAIGKSGDVVPDGVASLNAATIERLPSGGWTVRSADPSATVTVNGSLLAGAAMTDGSQVKLEGGTITFTAGLPGLAGLSDRLESDPTSHLFFSPSILSKAFPIVAAAFPVSISFGVLGFVFAIPFGLALAFMKMAKTRWLRFPATLYVDVVRGTPLFLQILIIVFAIPLLPAYKSLMAAAPWLNDAGPLGVSGAYWLRGLIVLSFNSAAYMAEICRAGIQSISKGQTEAARSLGMTAVQSMAFVILPQTVRRILPTMMSEFILLFKDTAMLSAVGVAEMVLRAREVAASTYNTSAYVVAAGFYLLLTIPLGRLVQRLENRLAASEGGTAGAAAEPALEPNAGDVLPPAVLPHERSAR